MDFTKYINKIPFPSKPRIPVVIQFKNFASDSSSDIGDYIDYLQKELIPEFELYKRNLEIYYKNNDLYNKENSRLYDLFKQDCFIEYGIEKHTKREQVFERAWFDGHPYGYSDVFQCMEKYVDLIKD